MPNTLKIKTRLQKVLFLDRDGVINVNHGYVYKKEDFSLIEGISKLIHQANTLGYLVIVVTNQSGIGRGFYSEAQFNELNDWMVYMFSQQGAHIDKVYYCPHHPTEALGHYAKICDCRKPKSGMALKAMNDFDIDLANSIMVGDKKTDIEFAMNANIPEVYWLNADEKDTPPSFHSRYNIIKIKNLSEINLR